MMGGVEVRNNDNTQTVRYDVRQSDVWLSNIELDDDLHKAGL